jgi:DNA-binding IscR family transcriptional regulator
VLFTNYGLFTKAVNIPEIVNIEGPVEQAALNILRDVPGVRTEVALGDGRRADVVVRAGGVCHVVEVKAQATINAANAHQLVKIANGLPRDTHLLTVARKSTEEARRLLQDAGIGLIDAQGNIQIDLPGLFVWTKGYATGAEREDKDDPSVKLTGKAGIATQALLREPKRWWHVTELAAAAHVSPALAHRVFSRLERDDLITVEGAGPKRVRRVANATALLDLLAEELQDRRVKRVRAYHLERDARARARTLSVQLAAAGFDHAVTGPAGASRLAPFVTSIPVVDIWVTEAVDLDLAVEAVGAESVLEGHNVLLRQEPADAPLAFRNQVDGVWTVNPFRLYCDLRRDPRRGKEQADRLRQEVIGF